MVCERGFNKGRAICTSSHISPAIPLNANTSTKIADGDDQRSFFTVHNNDATNGVWIKTQAASVDDDKKGIFRGPGKSWTMPDMATYIGEVSAIADAGTPDVYVTEY